MRKCLFEVTIEELSAQEHVGSFFLGRKEQWQFRKGCEVSACIGGEEGNKLLSSLGFKRCFHNQI